MRNRPFVLQKNREADHATMAGKPSLLLINYEFPPLGGGAGTATLNIARELARLGAEVTVLTSAFRGLPRQEYLHGYRVIRIPTLRRRKDRCSILEMIVFMISAAVFSVPIARKAGAQTTIAFFSIPSGPIAYLLKWFLRIPYIVSLRGGDVPGYLGQELAFFHRITAPITRLIWRNAAHVVANSEGLQRLACRSVPDTAVAIVPNGVDFEKFVPGNGNAHPVLSLLFVGRLHMQKGLDSLLYALHRLAPEYRNYRLSIVGDGPERDTLTRLAQDLQLADRIDFLGWVDRDRIPEVYAAADAFLFPSRDEGMPNAVLEAMAAGLPILATRISGSEELVVDRENGFLVAVDDIPAMAEALRLIIADPATRHRMGQASRRRIEQHYSWQSTAQAYFQMAAHQSS
ncbi:MAG TPA: glycosyltransferase family 4 protein [Dongiaceae bacterium]|nr:glycosyltransferase family 4 protein [Dongiaceae bacterium]